MCPGTLVGTFDPDKHQFVNQRFTEIHNTLVKTLRTIKARNKSMRVLLTVSPVPLTATNSGNHVMVATSESKSILRAVAGQIAENMQFVDYFPSYEIITAPPFKGMFYEDNKRSVRPRGVNHVMSNFFGCLDAKFGGAKAVAVVRGKAGSPGAAADDKPSDDDLVCEEELLAAFGR